MTKKCIFVLDKYNIVPRYNDQSISCHWSQHNLVVGPQPCLKLWTRKFSRLLNMKNIIWLHLITVLSFAFRFLHHTRPLLFSMAKLLQIARITFLLTLLILHTILFAKPSIEQYLEVNFGVCLCLCPFPCLLRWAPFFECVDVSVFLSFLLVQSW